MVSAKLKSVDSVDWHRLEEPADQPVFMELHIEVGVDGEDTADIFYGAVVNLPWVRQQVTARGHVLARGYVIMEPISQAGLVAAIEAKLAEIGPADSWLQLATKLNDYFAWEFEGRMNAALEEDNGTVH